MNCNQCGTEIPDNSVFCPFCGVPQKVTADYDYIQGEIGANVDKIKTGGGREYDSRYAAQDRKARRAADDLNKTRTVYGRDTIYEEERRTRNTYANERKRVPSDRRYYEDEYEEYNGRRPRYEYEDWGMHSGGGNKKTVIATIIIALICLAGIAAVIYFGLKPQDKQKVEDVVRCYNMSNVEVSEGEEFDGRMEVTLVSEQNYTIRYTLDGSEVSADSAEYSGPIISETPGPVQIKALSFDEDGEPSGEELNLTLLVTVMEETTTETPETEATEAEEANAGEAAVSKEEAEKIVERALVESGAMNEDYSTQNGGFINLVHAGEAVINDVDYYVIQSDYYDESGNIWETTYYGISMQEGALSYLEKQEDQYVIVE